jgi:integrase
MRATMPNKQRHKYISDADFVKICEEIDTRLLSAVKISYCFGLRCAEVLGLSHDDIYEDIVSVERQLDRLEPIAHFTPLKNKEKRMVPYWLCSPDDLYKLVSSVQRMHPDTLSHEFKAEMVRLKMPFQFHDLRRTWITNSLRKHHYRDVQLAAGHADLKTTQGYAQDDRELQRKKFKPRIALIK